MEKQVSIEDSDLRKSSGSLQNNHSGTFFSIDLVSAEIGWFLSNITDIVISVLMIS